MSRKFWNSQATGFASEKFNSLNKVVCLLFVITNAQVESKETSEVLPKKKILMHNLFTYLQKIRKKAKSQDLKITIND